jgi:hypothetical protein
MIDFYELSKEEFLFSYSYLTEAEYDNTEKKLLKMLSSKAAFKTLEHKDKDIDYDRNNYLSSLTSKYISKYIEAIYDSGNKYMDRYTIIINRDFMSAGYPYQSSYTCLCCSDNCDMPNGVGNLSVCRYYPFSDNIHLGKQITFEELPANVREYVIRRLTEDE